ncbi:hemopexin repeat-containing protein [Streptomyces syringium]
MIQAATNRNNDTVYFFRGEQYVAYNNPDYTLTADDGSVTVNLTIT